MTKDEKILEIINSKPTQKIGLDDFFGRQTVINMLNEAINYTPYCTEFICHSCSDKKSGQNDDQLHEVCKECFGSI